MRLFVFIVLLFLPAFAGAKDWRSFVVEDRTHSKSAPRKGVRITYLGTNGYLLEGGKTRILVDPYFTRMSVARVALNLPAKSSQKEVDRWLRKLPGRIDAIVVTHGHFDHLLDVPEVARRTGARVYASPTSIHLANAASLPKGKGSPVLPGARRSVAGASITVLPASHDKIFGCCIPFPGTVDQPLERGPRRTSHWVCGEPLAFLIELNGRRIYVDSGGTSPVLPPHLSRRVDLAILGTALPDSRRRLDKVLPRLRPRYFLPSHQDNFFRPLDRGFSFGKMTDFKSVRKTAERHPTEFIMLDYFRPWTLP